MEFTRRARGVTGLAVALAALAVLAGRPLLLGGAVGVGGWLLARQWRFAAGAVDAEAALSVEHAPAREGVTAGESVGVTLAATLAAPSRLAVQVRATPPVGTEGPPAADRTARLDPGRTRAQVAFPLRCPVAGRHDFGDAAVRIDDPAGLFSTSVEVPASTTLSVAARAPRRVHVGEGGERVAAFGSHPAGERGPGLDPAEVREYVPGDAADDIDWKATARLGEPHVREHEVETDRRALLVVDHRGSTADGPPGERKLDYLRQVALGYLDAARRNREPVGLLAVGDEGVTERVPSGQGDGHYEHVTRLVLGLEPTEPAADGDGDSEATPDRDSDPERTPGRGDDLERTPDRGGSPERTPDVPGEPRSPSAAGQAAGRLRGENSRFARRLAPFFGSATSYVERVTGDPLYAAVQGERRRGRDATVTLVLTDDERPAELREALSAAAAGERTAVAALAPSALFGEDRTGDLQATYGQYVAFEDLRRELAARDRVEAYEVAPADRIDAVLAAGGAGR